MRHILCSYYIAGPEQSIAAGPRPDLPSSFAALRRRRALPRATLLRHSPWATMMSSLRDSVWCDCVASDGAEKVEGVVKAQSSI